MDDLDIKDKILKGSADLFLKYGVRSISMDDIARHLAVSKKTLYQHFADKDELVIMVTKGHLERSRKEYEELNNRSKNCIEELAMIARCMKHDMEGLNPALLFDLQKFHPKAWNGWLEYKNKFIRESVIRNLSQGIEEGYIRTEIDPEVMATVRIELVQIAFNNDLFPPSRYKLADVQEQIFDHFVYGLVTEKGRKLYQKHKELNYQPSTVL